jgi:peptidoglycan hydrolase-like protein with peptidoglycan-binding domain
VALEELKILTKNSDSVRRLQTALGTNVTGNYDRGTQMAVRSWQNSHGFEGGRGIQVSAAQAELLFGDSYDVK